MFLGIFFYFYFYFYEVYSNKCGRTIILMNSWINHQYKDSLELFQYKVEEIIFLEFNVMSISCKS